MTSAAKIEKPRVRHGESVDLNFSVNPASKRLLDVLVSILSSEYIQIAKENPEIFSEGNEQRPLQDV
jgi:hypothetical protein